MEVVKYDGIICLADIIEINEDEWSTSYNRTYAFYDYHEVVKLEGKHVSEKDIDRCILSTKHVTGTELPFKRVDSFPPILIETKVVKVLTVKVAKPKTTYTFD